MPIVTIHERGVARVRAGHPWIWRADILRAPPELEPGPVLVEDARGRGVGGALWAARSPVALRLFETGAAPVRWDEALLERRLVAARDRRHALAAAAPGDAYRLAHAEADDLPGLVVDRYGDVLVVQTHVEALEGHAGAIAAMLSRIAGPRAIVLRNDGSARDFEGLPRLPPRLLQGESGRATFHEGAIAFEIDTLADAKTGSFLDQRENHLAVAPYGRQARRALDAFSYHGGFALQLAHAGAAQVVALDESQAAVERLRDNIARAGLEGRVLAQQQDAWDALRRFEAARERFDLIVLDPPALAKRRGSLAAAERAYHELNLRALRLLEPDGILVTCSCSARLGAEALGALLAKAAADAGRLVQILERRGPSRDHPERSGVPETAYLKCWICRVLPAAPEPPAPPGRAAR